MGALSNGCLVGRYARAFGWCLVFLSGFTAASCGGGLRRAPRPNIILISLDTLAARHLGLYGYDRDTSPNLERYAVNATVFKQAYSTAPKTAESHMSMFTSLYPSVHGVTTVKKSQIEALDERTRSFVQVLEANGYRTAGFHGGGNVDAPYGFARGFDVYEQAGPIQAVEWLEENGGLGPLFMFFHTYFVHDPYLPLPPTDRRFVDPDYSGPIIHSRDELLELAGSRRWSKLHRAFWARIDTEDEREVEHIVSLYDALVVDLDTQLATFLETIDRVVPGAVVIIVSDHGEEFGQHGEFTHKQIYGEVLHVPLIIRHPDRGQGLEVDEVVSTIDLAPTILDLASIPTIEQFQGRSLAGFLDGVGTGRAAFAECWDQWALIQDARKILVRQGDIDLFDLAADPEESVNIRGKEPEGFRTLARELEDRRKRNEAKKADLDISTDRVQLDPAHLEDLRALGYVE